MPEVSLKGNGELAFLDQVEQYRTILQFVEFRQAILNLHPAL